MSSQRRAGPAVGAPARMPRAATLYWLYIGRLVIRSLARHSRGSVQCKHMQDAAVGLPCCSLHVCKAPCRHSSKELSTPAAL